MSARSGECVGDKHHAAALARAPRFLLTTDRRRAAMQHGDAIAFWENDRFRREVMLKTARMPCFIQQRQPTASTILPSHSQRHGYVRQHRLATSASGKVRSS